jgi:hypothetical protein
LNVLPAEFDSTAETEARPVEHTLRFECIAAQGLAQIEASEAADCCDSSGHCKDYVDC